MEYRIKYREIPWPVAFGVLPGKIIGTFFIMPWKRFSYNWKYKVRQFAFTLLTIAIVTVVVSLVILLLDHGAFNDQLQKSIAEAWNQSHIVKPPTPTEIGLR